MKKVLLIIVDALASRVVLPALQTGRLPHLQALQDAGQLYPESVAIFPSLTPAATSSLITGAYPRSHAVLGFHWYDLAEDRVMYYGDDFWIIWRESFEEFFSDFLDRLNHQRLEASTLFQSAERANQKAACLNYLIFHGDVKHKADIPTLFSMIPGVPTDRPVWGPSILYFGDFVDSDIDKLDDSLDTVGGLFHRFGFDDENTAHLLLTMAQNGAMPNLTVAYFPDNDFQSHEVGPQKAITALESVDANLGRLFEAFGGLEQMLAEYCVVLTGDHAQTDMLDDEETAGICLDQLLDNFDIAEPGTPWTAEDQLVICPDMRSAQVYFHTLEPDPLQQAVTQLRSDERIDQIIWRAKDMGAGEQGYYVANNSSDRLHFWRGTTGPNSATDRYGGAWSWDGDLAVVDGQLSDDNTLTFGKYPNAFERIVGALDCPNSGHLWTTAKPGHEFCVETTSLHLGGGSHGSLHADDSLSPLFVAGAPAELALPERPRAVDITPLCEQVLGIQSEYALGESRAN